MYNLKVEIAALHTTFLAMTLFYNTSAKVRSTLRK